MGSAALERSRVATASDPINQALVLYTGFGKAAFPRARMPDVAAAFGEHEAQELKARILALYDELNQPLAEPASKGGRKSVTERATEQLARRHPELEEDGLKVLAWTYSFGLR